MVALLLLVPGFDGRAIRRRPGRACVWLGAGALVRWVGGRRRVRSGQGGAACRGAGPGGGAGRVRVRAAGYRRCRRAMMTRCALRLAMPVMIAQAGRGRDGDRRMCQAISAR